MLEVFVLAIAGLGALVAFFTVGRPWQRPEGWRDAVSRLGWRFLAAGSAAAASTAGLYVALVAGLAGAALGCLLVWLLDALLGVDGRTSRPGSLLAHADRARAPFGAGVALAALGVALTFSALGPFDALRPSPSLGIAFLLLGLGLQGFAWSRGARAAHEIARLGRTAQPVDALPPPRAFRTVDVGVGEQTWLVDRSSGAPYREGAIAALRILGDPLEATHAALQGGRLRVPVIALTSACLGVILASPEPDRAPPTYTEIAPVAIARARASTTTRTYLSWYPQARPILEDLNGDRVDDIVGLRWDSSHESAALHVVANDGVTFEELWRSDAFPAQWYGGSTFLVPGGGALFMTDGEGNLRVFDKKTGAMKAFADVPRAASVCGLSDPAGVFLANERWQDDGLSFDVAGHRTETKRPTRCAALEDVPRCPAPGGAPCSRSSPPSLDGVLSAYGTTWEQRDVGISIGVPVRGGEPPRNAYEPHHVFGFEPSSGKRRFDVPLAFDDRPLHANPSLQTTFAGGRVFAFYQLKSGDWTLGARDGKTGEVVWQVALPRADMGTHFQSMHATESRLYVALDHRLEVFDSVTGRSVGVVW